MWNANSGASYQAAPLFGILRGVGDCLTVDDKRFGDLVEHHRANIGEGVFDTKPEGGMLTEVVIIHTKT
jgi:hypothetical protein